MYVDRLSPSKTTALAAHCTFSLTAIAVHNVLHIESIFKAQTKATAHVRANPPPKTFDVSNPVRLICVVRIAIHFHSA